MDFLLVKLILTLRLESGSLEPHLLHCLKKPFEESFRKIACLGRGNCDCCRDELSCPYRDLFGQELARDPEVIRRHQKPPLPFAFHLPVLAAPLKRGDEFELGLVLAGRATGFVEEFCKAMELLFTSASPGNMPAAALIRVESAGCSGFRSLVFREKGAHDPTGLCTISLDDLLAMNTLAADRISLRILTPLRNLHEGRVVTAFSFSSFIRPLLRRISSLSRYYYGNSLTMDYKRLAAQSESIEIREGNFHWVQRTNESPEGIMGSGTLHGPLTDFHPALLLGEYLHCGKGAAYGLGRFEILH